MLDDVKVQSAPECTVPYDLMATNKGAGKVNVSWQASFDADSFEVIISRDTIEPEMIQDLEENEPHLFHHS